LAAVSAFSLVVLLTLLSVHCVIVSWNNKMTMISYIILFYIYIFELIKLIVA